MTRHTKKELFGIEISHYLKSSRKAKGVILDALERQTGMRRESIIRSFKRTQTHSDLDPPGKRGRKQYYTPDVLIALKEIWEAANSCCGELLQPVMAEYVSIFKRDKMWQHSELATKKLLEMSVATVKRKVSGWQCESGRKGISTTTPSAIKDRVPIFQGSWHEVDIGMGQIDTVAHCGGSLAGDFVFSLGYVDVASGWIEYVVQWNKGMIATQQSLELIRLRLPFLLKHIHPDCGLEFLNNTVISWCEQKQVAVSRSRSYHKNDNGYIEQRNGHIARRWLGYERLGCHDLLGSLNRFYELICLYHNHFIAQRLCLGKKILPTGKQRKVYEAKGQTPYMRILGNEAVADSIKKQLIEAHGRLNPNLLNHQLLKIKCDILKTNRQEMSDRGLEIFH